jgi:hypothetical protein
MLNTISRFIGNGSSSDELEFERNRRRLDQPGGDPKRSRLTGVPPSGAPIAVQNSFALLAPRVPEHAMLDAPPAGRTLHDSIHAPPPGEDANQLQQDQQQTQQPNGDYATVTARPPKSSPRGKRKGGPITPFKYPTKERGDWIHRSPDFEAQERPTPTAAVRHVLWMHVGYSEYTSDEVFAEAHGLIGDDACGTLAHGGMRCLGIVFPSREKMRPYIDKILPVSNVKLVTAAKGPAYTLRRYTLIGVPNDDKTGLIEAICSAFSNEHGTVTEITPLVTPGTKWMTNTFHVSVRPSSAQYTDPAMTVQILDEEVLVNIPGQRRVCPVCRDTQHTNPKCRKGQTQQANSKKWQDSQQHPGPINKQPESPADRQDTPAHHNDSPPPNWEDADETAETRRAKKHRSRSERRKAAEAAGDDLSDSDSGEDDAEMADANTPATDQQLSPSQTIQATETTEATVPEHNANPANDNVIVISDDDTVNAMETDTDATPDTNNANGNDTGNDTALPDTNGKVAGSRMTTRSMTRTQSTI